MAIWKKIVSESTSGQITQNALTATTAGTITSQGSLATRSTVLTTHIASNAVTSAEIADETIVGANIADDAISQNNISADSVGLHAMYPIAKGKIIYGNDSGNPAYLAVGTNGEALMTNSSGQIEWGTVSTVTDIASLTDTTIEASSAIVEKEVISWNDTSNKWVNRDLATAGIQATAANLTALLGATTGQASGLANANSSTVNFKQITVAGLTTIGSDGALEVGAVNSTFKGNVTVQSGTTQKFKVNSSSGNTDIEGTLDVLGNATFEGTLSTIASTDTATTNTTFTLNSDSSGPSNSANSGLIIDVDAGSSEIDDQPKLIWQPGGGANSLGTGWVLQSDHTAQTTTSENMGNQTHILSAYIKNSAPASTNKPYGEGVMTYDYQNGELYICTDIVNNPS